MDLNQSGTREEELLLGRETVERICRIRRQIRPLPITKATQTLLESLSKFPSNKEFLASIAL